MLCFKDMSAADLTVTRTTDLQGNTLWRDSPMLAAAIKGDVVLLEGLDRLHPGEDRQVTGWPESVIRTAVLCTWAAAGGSRIATG